MPDAVAILGNKLIFRDTPFSRGVGLNANCCCDTGECLDRIKLVPCPKREGETPPEIVLCNVTYGLNPGDPFYLRVDGNWWCYTVDGPTVLPLSTNDITASYHNRTCEGCNSYACGFPCLEGQIPDTITVTFTGVQTTHTTIPWTTYCNLNVQDLNGGFALQRQYNLSGTPTCNFRGDAIPIPNCWAPAQAPPPCNVLVNYYPIAAIHATGGSIGFQAIASNGGIQSMTLGRDLNDGNLCETGVGHYSRNGGAAFCAQFGLFGVGASGTLVMQGGIS